MKILLIQVHTGEKSSIFDKFVYTLFYPSLTLQQLAASLPNKYEVDIVDERRQEVNFDWDGDLVGISSLTFCANHAYELADEFRRRGKTVILGGYHPSSLPTEAKQHADSVVIGEAEKSLQVFLSDYEKHKIKPFYQSTHVDPELIPSPVRTHNRFSVTDSVQASRGCPYSCKYCAIQKVEGSLFRMRPIEKVIEEIKSIPSKRLFFADSSLTINPTYSKNLFKEMTGLNKKFNCYGNIDRLSKDEELLKLANDAGCDLWLVGFESINQSNLKNVGKRTNKSEEYSIGIKKVKDHGMMIMGLFMFGFDHDTPSVFDTTLNAIYEWELDKAGFAMLTPFPGTALFNEFEKEGRFLTKDWSKYNMKNVVIQPKNMTPNELFEGTTNLIKEFYSLPNSFKRAINDNNFSANRFFSRIIGDISLRKFYKIFGC